MRVTIRQLAEYCNVSKGTIGRVINGKSDVNPETRERVQKAIADLGYQPHYLARSLAKGRTNSIGILLWNLRNPFFSEIADSIVQTASELMYSPTIMLSQKSTTHEEQFFRNFVSRQMDGIALFSNSIDPGYLDFVRTCGVPVITLMTPIEGVPNIGIDDRMAMQDATNLVLSKGYSRILFVSPSLAYKGLNIAVTEQRYQGFLDAISKKSIYHELIVNPDYLHTLNEKVCCHDERTAIVCTSDVYAIDIINYLDHCGLYAPNDYGIIGFDGIKPLQYIKPAVSTVSVPIEDIGAQAVHKLSDMIEGKEIGDEIFEYSVIAGQTL